MAGACRWPCPAPRPRRQHDGAAHSQAEVSRLRQAAEGAQGFLERRAGPRFRARGRPAGAEVLGHHPGIVPATAVRLTVDDRDINPTAAVLCSHSHPVRGKLLTISIAILAACVSTLALTAAFAQTDTKIQNPVLDGHSFSTDKTPGPTAKPQPNDAAKPKPTSLEIITKPEPAGMATNPTPSLCRTTLRSTPSRSNIKHPNDGKRPPARHPVVMAREVKAQGVTTTPPTSNG